MESQSRLEGTGAPAGSVVVGVDGSPESRHALMWAAQDAVRRGAPLHIVHTVRHPRMVPRDQDATVEDAEALGEWVNRRAVKRVAAAHPELAVTSESRAGRAAREIVELSRRAVHVVLGARGRGALSGMLLGSVSQQVASHAHCPVTVVRTEHEGDPAGPVLVGMDSSEAAREALVHGFEEADRRGSVLRVLHASYIELVTGGVAPTAWPEYYDEIFREEREAVEKSVDAVQRDYPSVAVEVADGRGHPGQLLADASGEASLVVVGSRGLGGFSGLMLGSVSQAVLTRSQCPVTIVRGEVSRPDAA